MKNFTRRCLARWEQVISTLCAFVGVPRLTPEQEARIAEMERDYEQHLGLKPKDEKDSTKHP